LITLKEDEMHSERNTNHHRRSIRLKGYDYAQAGLYFITICVQDRVPLFGEIIDGKMALNTFGHIAWEEWLATEKIRDNIALHEFIIMPDHIHGIIEIKFQKKDSQSENGKFKSPSQTIGAVIRGFKIATIKKIKDIILNPDCWGELQFAPSEELQIDPKIFNLNKNLEDLSSLPKAEKSKSFSDSGDSDSLPDSGDSDSPPDSGDSDSPPDSGDSDSLPDSGDSDSPPDSGDSDSPPDSGDSQFDSGTGELQFAPTKKIIQLNFKIWQRNYYEHIIRNEPSYLRISEYIKNNPAKWTKNKSKTK